MKINLSTPLRYPMLYLLGVLFYCHPVEAQQQLMFSRYQFAPLLYNPAASGISEGTDLRLGHRSQWVGVDGAPNSQFLSIDRTLGENTAGGVTFSNDQSGPLAMTNFAANYAYRIRISEKDELRLGIAVSMANWRTDWSKINLKDVDDPSFQVNINRWLPNAGAGFQFNHGGWQFALGVPRFFEYQLTEEKTNDIASRTFRHFYGSGQKGIYINRHLIITPRFLIGSNSWLSDSRYSSPTTADLGISMTILNDWYGGISWRTVLERKISSDRALSIQAGYSHGRLRVAAAYDLSLNALQRVSAGSFEVMAGYVFPERKVKTASFTPPVIFAPEKISEEQIPQKIIPKPVIPAVDTPISDYNIKGIVFDMTSGLPAENARVTISSPCGAPVEAFITGPDGRYSFGLQANCCYQITAQKDGLKAGISNNICTNNPEQQSLRADLDLTKQ